MNKFQIREQDGDVFIAEGVVLHAHLFNTGKKHASLLAAAHDLLEALEAWMDEAHKDGPCNCHLCENTRAAIAKAKGDSK